MKDELLIRYITGQATPSEIKQVIEWSSLSTANYDELLRSKNAWILAGLNRPVNQEIKKDDIRKILGRINKTKPGYKSSRFRIISGLGRIAAVLILALITGVVGFYLSQKGLVSVSYTEVVVARGERSKVVLPDGSLVLLNSESRLKFPASFHGSKRKVELEGEAYFEVRHNANRPFIVHSADLDVEVLGTRFNLCNYPDEDRIETYLESGRIKIALPGMIEKDKLILNPSEAFQYNRSTGEQQKLTCADTHLTDWTRGILTIRGETIEQLSKKLERRFNVSIHFRDNQVKQHTYSGSISDQDLNIILEAMSFTSSLSFERKDDKVTIWSKKKK